MRDFVRRIFTDESGNPSSNRVFGALLCGAGLVAAFVSTPAASTALLASGVSLLGVGQIKSAVVSAAQAQPATPAQPAAVTPSANEVPPK